MPYSFLCFILFSYLAFSVPISYDEATTFNFFVEPGIKTSVSYYPAPNNHILYSLGASILKYLPLDQTYELRLFSIFSSVFTIIFAHHVLLKFFSKTVAVIGSLILIIFPGFLFYSFLARGYSLTVLLFFIGFYAQFRVSQNKDAFYYLLFFISSVLGFYAIPSYFYCYISLVVLGVIISFLQQDLWKIKSWIYVSIMIIFCSGLLYSPIIYYSGLDSLIHNRFIEPFSTKVVLAKLYQHFNEVSIFLTGYELIISIPFFLIVLLYFIFSRKRNKSLLTLQSLYLLFVTPVLITIHSVIPFERTWLYLTIPIWLIVMIMISELNYLLKQILISVALINLIFLILDFWSKREILYFENYKAEMISNTLLNENLNSVYFSDPIINRIVAYNLSKEGSDIGTGVGKPFMKFSSGDIFISTNTIAEDDNWILWKKLNEFYFYKYL